MTGRKVRYFNTVKRFSLGCQRVHVVVEAWEFEAFCTHCRVLVYFKKNDFDLFAEFKHFGCACWGYMHCGLLMLASLGGVYPNYPYNRPVADAKLSKP